MDTRRVFVDPDTEIEYFIGSPTAEDVRQADYKYSKSYTRCLEDGIATSAEMTDILRKRGIVGSNFDRRHKELVDNLSYLVNELNIASSNDDKTTLALRTAAARQELVQWNKRISIPMSNTCEQISEDVKIEFLTAALVQNKDGSKVWPTYEDFLKSDSPIFTSKARYEVMLYLQGYESNFLDMTPEAVALKQVKEAVEQEALENAAEAILDEAMDKSAKVEGD